MDKYLSDTYFIDKDHPRIKAFSDRLCKGGKTDIDRAVSLYYGVRDEIRYNPYAIDPEKSSMQASRILEQGEGYCVAKAVLLAACLRSQAIPARLGFADVRNHLVTGRLKEMMETDLFIWHGYTDIHLNGKWVKATPAFNLSLCEAFQVKPLEFDGTGDSVFHPLDALGNRHMEYVRDHGTFADLPWQRIISDLLEAYPGYFRSLGRETGDFRAEAVAENSG
ncbi:transglutaminase-like domain-containing protein [Desulfospira joergensenii]|uniref:transglutaminase-like domain-containing protein n=1 Tax=Desulfospira joergensenii TaxID=53329 RepID=UPI0003B3EDE4|nr:transglutaminase family protein [Desulfospira joergensenii]